MTKRIPSERWQQLMQAIDLQAEVQRQKFRDQNPRLSDRQVEKMLAAWVRDEEPLDPRYFVEVPRSRWPAKFKRR